MSNSSNAGSFASACDAGAFEFADEFTALIRPSALCIRPSVDPDLRGTLVARLPGDGYVTVNLSTRHFRHEDFDRLVVDVRTTAG